MNPKQLKKIIKRQTAKKRAQRQTIRRHKQLETGRFKDQVAQDIYESLQASLGKRKQTRGEYSLKDYSYNMFKFGDPIRVGGKVSSAIHVNGRKENGRSQARREHTRDLKKEQKRKALWGQNIKLKRERKTKANREARKKRRTGEVKPVRRSTSRKLKMS